MAPSDSVKAVVVLVEKCQNEAMPRKSGWTDLERALFTSLNVEAGYTFAIAQAQHRKRSGVAAGLKRLETMGMARSKWDTSGGPGPPRRVYTLTAKGRREHAKLG